MLLEILVPQIAIAKEEVKAPSEKQEQIGLINGNSYDSKLMLELNRLKARSRGKKSANPGISLFGYFEEDQEPKDEDKLKYHGEVKAKLTVNGLDGNTFQWSEIFGTEEVHLRFTQINDETDAETGVERVLNISQAGTYTWTDGDGNPAELPLFNNKLEPLIYEVKLDEEVSDKVKLLTARLATTGDANTPTFEKPDAEGRIKYHLTLEIGLQQVASSKFVSEWHTAVEENTRPQIQGTMTGSNGSLTKSAIFDLPKNDTDSVVIRTNSPKQGRKPDKIFANFLYKKPTTDIKTDTAGLTFDTTEKTVKSGDHKFKYDFKYDVINGGKLTMTEILPVTFDANGGKFASITGEGATQKIVKEVEYDGTLTDKVEKPSKDLETFKGWATKENGKPLSEEDFKKEITNVKEKKTFYAIWDNNEITAEELEVKESFKDGETWVNDFIPKIADLKKQVKIKDANGDPQALANDDTFAIVDGQNEYTTDDALKTYLYGKLQEKNNPKDEPTRVETIKAKVTHANGTSQEVDIPIKVIKNIYEAKTLTQKPFYVPDGYVKVTVDPTTKAQEPQKYFYYVNPAAKVVIPGKDPVGTGDNKFVKWTMKADSAAADVKGTDYTLTDRHKFEEASTITAQYVSDVIPQEGDTKPEGTPDNFVKVTFVPTDDGTMEGAKIFWVNPEKEVTIPVKNPVGKQYFTFNEWKMGEDAKGEKYTPSTPKKFTEATIITATYTESDKIIPFDPTNLDDPKVVRPEGYVKITFEAEKGLKLTEQKAYYVKANAKDVKGKPLTLGNVELAKPAYEAQTGYKFDKWDKEDTTVIGATDIVVTAKATKLDNVIPEKDKNDKPNEKPKGYKEVTFVIKTGDAAKGTLEGTTKYYVNPNEYVTITPPTTKANTGFEFGAWDKDATIPTVYDKDTTITGSFNGLKDVIPKTKTDDSEKPKDYVTVTFVIEGKGGKIVDGETITYFVKPNTDVTIPQPKTIAETGYEFDKWNQDTVTKAKKYDKDTTVKGNFKKLDDIVDGNKAKPEGYVTVTFIKGDHGTLSGNTVFYINPKTKQKLSSINKPEVKPEIGYKLEDESGKFAWEILGAINQVEDFVIDKDMVIEAKYKELDSIVPEKNEQGSKNKIPEGYIEVKFSAEADGKIKDTTDTKTKIVYVNPNKAVVLKNQAPEVTPNTGFDFAGWDTQIERAIQYKDKDVIKAKYNVKGDVIPQKDSEGKDKPAGYLTVTFDKGDHGKEITGQTVYYVKPNKDVTVPAPTVKPSVGYEFKKWDKELTQTFTEENTTITAQYEALGNIIPGDQTKPDGYVTVTFDKGDHGTLSGTTVYYVNPNANPTKKLADITTKPTVKAETGYKFIKWDTDDNFKIKADKTVKATYEKLKDVIPKTTNDDSEKPDGYVTVKLIPTDKATDKTEKVYFVNPNKEVTIPDNTPTGKEVTDVKGNKYTYIFKGWTVTRGVIASWDKVDEANNPEIKGTFKQDTDITAKYNIKAENLVNGPIAKENFVTQINEKPEAKDLIANVSDLPQGTNFEYEKEPDVSQAGDTTAKVKVTYPNNKTVVVEVPIKVVDNVIPQEGTEKPENVPQDFVQVTFVPTDKGSMEGAKIFWVKPNTEVTIPVKDPVGKTGFVFKEWKIGDVSTGETYTVGTPKTFTEQETTITATYTESDSIIPFDPKAENPMKRPDGYVRVTFDADLGLKLTESKAFYVKKNANVKLSQLGKPNYDQAKGYAFDGWDKADNTVITEDMVVTAKAKESSSPAPSPDPSPSPTPTPDSSPSYPRVVHRDRIVEKEKIVEKIVRVGESQFFKEVRYMQGFNGYFRPNDGLTRAEAAQILANALVEDGYKYNPNFKISYKDVGEAWYTRAVKIVTEAKVFAGYDDGNFKPQAKITRNEWIATLKRFQELGDASGNNMNLRDDHWAKGEIQAAFNEGWLKIYTDGLATYKGDEFIPRQEVAAVSNKAFKRIVDKTYIGKNNLSLVTYKDVNTSMWAYEDILCASNTFLDRKDRYIAHWVKEDKNQFNIDTSDLKIVQKNFQRNPR